MKFVLKLLLFTFPLANTAIASEYIKYGVAGNIGNFSVEDPDGDTASQNSTYLSGILLTPVNRNNPSMRLWYEFSFRSFDLDASTSNIGQEVNSLSISATLQKGWSTKTIDAYWVGIGAALSLDDYSDRFKLDNQGFLSQQFNDRSETILGIIFNAGFNMPAAKGYMYGFNFNFHLPIDDGVSGISTSLFVMW